MEVWIVTHTDRYGVGNYVFSTEAKASAFHDALMRKQWPKHFSEPVPDDPQEMYERFAEVCCDDDIEIDRAVVDEQVEVIVGTMPMTGELVRDVKRRD